MTKKVCFMLGVGERYRLLYRVAQEMIRRYSIEPVYLAVHGAMVTKNIPDHAIVAGNQAKQIGWVCHCGERLSEDLKCSTCGKRYRKKGDGIQESYNYRLCR